MAPVPRDIPRDSIGVTGALNAMNATLRETVQRYDGHVRNQLRRRSLKVVKV